LIEYYFPEFIETYLAYDLPIKQHDAARSAILYVHGGVYMDHDIVPLKNIEPLLGKCSAVFTVYENDEHRVNNNFMASVPKFRLWKLAIEQYPLIAHMSVLEATGPKFLSNLLESVYYKISRKVLKIYSTDFTSDQ